MTKHQTPYARSMADTIRLLLPVWLAHNNGNGYPDDDDADTVYEEQQDVWDEICEKCLLNVMSILTILAREKNQKRTKREQEERFTLLLDALAEHHGGHAQNTRAVSARQAWVVVSATTA
jgi:hypothetical protein